MPPSPLLGGIQWPDLLFWFFCRTLPSLIFHPAPLHSAQFHLLDLVSFNIFLQELVTSMWIWLLYDFCSGASQVALVKNPPAYARDTRDMSSIPGSGRSPGRRNGNSLQYLCLEISMDRGTWWATVHGSQRVGHSWVTEHMTFAQPLFGVFILFSKALNIFFNLFIFYWRIIALQNFSVFCQTST